MADSEMQTMNRGLRVRVYPTDDQAASLRQWIGTARFLWNLARDQRRWFSQSTQVVQCRDLTELRNEVEWLAEMPAQTQQHVLADLDMAWQRCWAGLSKPPTLRRQSDPMSLRFPQKFAVRRLNKRWGEVRLAKLGWVRFRWTHSLDGKIKNITVSGSNGLWHAAFCLEIPRVPSVPNGQPPVGVDRGVAIAFMTSDGKPFDRPMWKPGEKARLLQLERLKAKQVKGSNRYARTCQAIATLHRRVANRRHDFAHKVSTDLAKNHGLVAIEALVIQNMTKSAKGTVAEPGRSVAAKSGLNRAILDKGWGLVNSHLGYKCPWYGSLRVEVPPQNTSIECPKCGLIDKANRPFRSVFLCVGCGHADHADANAGVIIRERGIKLALTGGHPGLGRKASKRLRTWRQPAQEVEAGIASPRNPLPRGAGDANEGFTSEEVA